VRYDNGPPPALRLAGRASVASLKANQAIINGQTFAAVADLANDAVLASATTGRIEWYRLSQARVGGWKPFQAVELTDSSREPLPLGIFGMALAPREQRLVVADISGEVQCLDSQTGKREGRPFKHVSEVFGMAAHEASSTVVASDARGGWLSIAPLPCKPASVREPPTPFGGVAADAGGRLVSSPQVEAARTAISFSPDGALVAVTGHDGTARLYLAATGALAAIAPHRTMTRSAAVSADHQRMAVGTADGRVALWRVDRGAERVRRAGVDAFATDGADRHALIVGGGAGWEIDILTGETSAAVSGDALQGYVQAAAGSRPGSYAVWSHASARLALLRRQATGGGPRLALQTLDLGSERRATVFAVAPLPEGRWAVAEHGEGALLRIIDENGQTLRQWPLTAPAAALAATGTLIAAADEKGAGACGGTTAKPCCAWRSIRAWRSRPALTPCSSPASSTAPRPACSATPPGLIRRPRRPAPKPACRRHACALATPERSTAQAFRPTAGRSR